MMKNVVREEIKEKKDVHSICLKQAQLIQLREKNIEIHAKAIFKADITHHMSSFRETYT